MTLICLGSLVNFQSSWVRTLTFFIFGRASNNLHNAKMPSLYQCNKVISYTLQFFGNSSSISKSKYMYESKSNPTSKTICFSFALDNMLLIILTKFRYSCGSMLFFEWYLILDTLPKERISSMTES